MKNKPYRAFLALTLFSLLFASITGSALAADETNAPSPAPANSESKSATSTPPVETPAPKITKPTPVPIPTCPVQKEVDALNQAIQNPQADYMAELQIELNLRKAILGKVIGCAEGEAKSLRDNLADKKTNDTDLEKLRTNLLGELDRILNFYASQKSMVKDVGLRSSQEVARSVRDWRTSTYGPTAQATSNLLLWIRDDNLLAIADSRAGQIHQTVYFLQLQDNEKITENLDIAKNALIAARKEHTLARDLLVVRDEEALTHLKASLGYLSDAYNAFFEISDTVSKLLKP